MSEPARIAGAPPASNVNDYAMGGKQVAVFSGDDVAGNNSTAGSCPMSESKGHFVSEESCSENSNTTENCSK